MEFVELIYAFSICLYMPSFQKNDSFGLASSPTFAFNIERI